MSGDFVYAMPDDARAFARALLIAHGFPERDAATAAGCLMRADMRGVETHGLLRLPIYLDRVRKGLINPKPRLKPERKMPAAAALDGENGLGFVVGSRAMAEACAIADELGVGLVSVRRSTHFGMAANFVLLAVEKGFAALVLTNASRALPPYGGRTPLLGTGPLAAGMPGGTKGPFVLDMSPTVAARGKIRLALKHGRKIPEGWALDAQGRPTTNPQAAMEGVMMPLGGAKGSGLALLADIFGGVISGAAFGGDVRDQYKHFDAPQNVGHFFLAFKPGLFVGAAELRARMDTLIGRVKASESAEGFDQVLIPGEPEARKEAHRRIAGIAYGRAEIADVQREAERAGQPPLHVSETPFA